MKKKVDFILFYENEVRELENIILLKIYLESEGYSVKISDAYGPKYIESIVQYNPQVVVVPWLRNNEDIFRFSRFKTKITKIVNLQWEQIFRDKDIKEGMQLPIDLAQCANHICWGEFSKKQLLKQGICEENLKITGAMQLDFCRNNFLNYYQSKEKIAGEYNLDEKKRWNLFISSFSYTKLSNQKIKEYKKYGNCEAFIGISEKSKEMLLKWIIEFLENQKDTEFIYRPHPAEVRDNDLEKIQKKYKNFHIIDKYSVKQWIKICDIINNWFSTSIAEVYYMNKKCNIIRPLKIPYDLENEIMKSAKVIKDKETFLKKNYFADEKEGFPIKKEYLNLHYYFDPIEPAYKKTGKYLIELLKSNKNYDFNFSKADRKKIKKRLKKSTLYSCISYIYIALNLKLSTILPGNCRMLKNIEKYNGIDKRIDEIEKNLNSCLEY